MNVKVEQAAMRHTDVAGMEMQPNISLNVACFTVLGTGNSFSAQIVT